MIPEGNPYNNWRGNGLDTLFDFDFYIEDETQLAVLHTNSEGKQTLLQYERDYSIQEFKNPGGSKIQFPLEGSNYGVLQENEIISLCLSLPIAQENEYGKSDYLDQKAYEYSFDYLTRICQIINRQVQRAVIMPEGSNITPQQLAEDLLEAEKNAIQQAGIATQKAAEAEASATTASTQAEIATQKTAEVVAAHQTAMSDIETSRSSAVGEITTLQTSATEAITQLESNALQQINNSIEQIDTSCNNAISSVSLACNDAVETITQTKETAISDVQGVCETCTTNISGSVSAAQNTISETLSNLNLQNDNVLAGIEDARINANASIHEAERQAIGNILGDTTYIIVRNWKE